MADNVVIAMGVALVELNLGAGPAHLDDPEDLTSFTVVLEGDGDRAPRRWRPAASLGLGDHTWVRTDALRRLAGPIATPEWESAFAAMLEYARTRGWVDDEHGAVRGHVERRRRLRHARRGRRRGVSGALRDAVLLSFDNLGEAADLERHGSPARARTRR